MCALGQKAVDCQMCHQPHGAMAAKLLNFAKKWRASSATAGLCVIRRSIGLQAKAIETRIGAQIDAAAGNGGSGDHLLLQV